MVAFGGQDWPHLHPPAELGPRHLQTQPLWRRLPRHKSRGERPWNPSILKNARGKGMHGCKCCIHISVAAMATAVLYCWIFRVLLGCAKMHTSVLQGVVMICHSHLSNYLHNAWEDLSPPAKKRVSACIILYPLANSPANQERLRYFRWYSPNFDFKPGTPKKIRKL